MKKLLLAGAFALAAVSAQAQQTMSIVWPFGMGDTQAQYSRVLLKNSTRHRRSTTSSWKIVLEQVPQLVQGTWRAHLTLC